MTECNNNFGTWRSMKNESPKENGDYLVYTDYGEIEIAFWDCSYWLGIDTYPIDVDYWMFLPAIPTMTNLGGKENDNG